jgi:hypothetical protein
VEQLRVEQQTPLVLTAKMVFLTALVLVVAVLQLKAVQAATAEIPAPEVARAYAAK